MKKESMSGFLSLMILPFIKVLEMIFLILILQLLKINFKFLKSFFLSC